MNKKTWKVLGAGGLALFMGIGTLCGVLLAPMNAAQVSTTGATSASNSANLAGAAQSPSRAPMPQENLVAGGEALELNPQIDETIFTTESGFEIKSHSVAGQTVANSKVQYFTLGSYNGTPLNWIILATSTTMAENTTPAGKAINGDANNGKQTLSMMTTSNLSANQMLVISEKVIPVATGTFKITAKSGVSERASTLFYGSLAPDTYAKNEALTLIDANSDYYSTYTTPDFSLPNNWITGSNLGLSSYCGNKIVKNSNFNSSYYAFVLTKNQVNGYLPTSLRAATDTSGTARNYWCSDGYSSSIVHNNIVVSTQRTQVGMSYQDVYRVNGNGVLLVEGGGYINTVGSVSTPTSISITGVLSPEATASVYGKDDYKNYLQAYAYQNKSYYISHALCTYSASTTNSVTAYYRPAMVVDLSKF